MITYDYTRSGGPSKLLYLYTGGMGGHQKIIEK